MNGKELIFISGTGRSGTHLIGRSISTHPNITGRIESKNTFGLITKIATTQDYECPLLISELKDKLKKELNKILRDSETHILEKSHPSLWLVDFLIEEFDSKFIFVYREVEPTVSSMLEHDGVLSWYDRLPLDKPNRFLGISEDNCDYFEDYSIEEKCSLRWKSHYEHIKYLNEKYLSNTILIKYEDFLANPSSTIKDISDFLSISNEFKVEKIKSKSFDKWKYKLTKEQLNKIRKITN